jgi:hypothetical protein
MVHYGFHQRGVVIVILLAFVFFAIQAPIHAQIKPPKGVLKVVLIDSASKGFSKTQSELFFTNLQKKVSQFEMLSVLLKSDLVKELNPSDKAALDKCSILSCLQQIYAKVGTERIILCTITLQGNVYHFVSSEYGVKNSSKLSDINEEAICTSSTEINDYITRIAVAIGQKTTRSDYIPDSLRTNTTSWWWYAGGAAIVGLGAGILLSTKQSKGGPVKEEPVTDGTLPTAPDLP